MADTPPILAWIADLLRLPERVGELETQQKEMEATMADYREEIDAINAETDSLSARIDAVIANQAIDDPAVEAELTAISNRLKGLAADPANPVPPIEEPPVEPTPEG